MADVITSVVTTTVAATAAASPTKSGTRAAHQGGILEGANPSEFNPKDPIIVFIIQVRLPGASSPRGAKALLTSRIRIGRHYHHLLPPPALSFVQTQTATSDCGNHWGYPARPLGPGSDTRLQRTHLSGAVHAHPLLGGKPGLGAFLVSGRPGSGFATSVFQLEDCSGRRSRRNGAAVRARLCHRVWFIPSIQRRRRARADKFRNFHALYWCRHGNHGMWWEWLGVIAANSR